MPQQRKITETLSMLAWVVALVVTISLPAGYFLVSYQYLVGSLEAEAEINSNLISKVISSNPEMWQFEQVRLLEILSQRKLAGHSDNWSILDLHGKQIVEGQGRARAPYVKRSFLLEDAGTPIALLEISCSLRPMLLRTGLATLIGLLLGGGVLIVLRVIPLRVVAKGEQALQEANDFLQRVMESSTNAIVVVDAAARILMANRRTAELTDYEVDMLIGRPLAALFPPEEFGLVEGQVRGVLSDESAMVQLETAMLGRSGRRRRISCGVAPLKQEGKIVGMVLSAEDITERIMTAEKLRAYAAELQANNEELRNFAYIMSHDLRAPLVNIKGFAEELRMGVKELEPLYEKALPLLEEEERERALTICRGEIPEAVDFINSSVTRMDALIAAVLRLSRLGRRELHPERIDLKELVRVLLKTLAHQLEERQVTVTVLDLPELVADRSAMEQIIGNLLDNAVKYLEPGRPGEIEISGEQGAADTTIRVRDNGRGIADEDLEKVFEIFRRAGRPDTVGEGMGLAYVKALLKNLGGSINCQSKLGVGSTFSFTLPHLRHWQSIARTHGTASDLLSDAS